MAAVVGASAPVLRKASRSDGLPPLARVQRADRRLHDVQGIELQVHVYTTHSLHRQCGQEDFTAKMPFQLLALSAEAPAEERVELVRCSIFEDAIRRGELAGPSRRPAAASTQ